MTIESHKKHETSQGQQINVKFNNHLKNIVRLRIRYSNSHKNPFYSEMLNSDFSPVITDSYIRLVMFDFL